ncbi:MAG: tripartite tricarboxylate transporter substrate binding protein [Burkholderiales bacterium]|nr:tripartite tricarboxylate transporter substrate binding protein [Burkholderiales bacterium]
MSKWFKRVGAVLLGFALVAPVAVGQTYPSRSVRIIVPFSPGGGTDTFARVVAQKLQERLGQSFVVENKPGAAGNIGADLVAKAPADGYTLLLAQDSLTIVPYLSKSLPFDVNKDFAPIGIGVFMPMMLVASNNTPASTLAELVTYAKAHPGKLSYGTPGMGTAHHLNFETLLSRTGMRMVHIPYKGASPMMADIVSGNVQVAFSALSSTLPYSSSGKIKVLAVADRERVPQFKDVPSIAESLPEYTAHAWFGLMAPAGTAQTITRRLSDELRLIVSLPDVRERLEAMGYQVKPTTPAEMHRLMQNEYEKWGQVIRAANIKPE